VTFLPFSRWSGSWEQKILLGILVAAIPMIVCGAALAQPAPPPDGRVGHFDQGIPVYWPYHAILMSAGFVLLFSGFMVARFHKTGNWYKTHRLLETTGAACIVSGLFVGVYMVALSGFPHLRNIHEVLGAVAGIVLIATLALGYSITRAGKSGKVVRKSHRWLGRTTLTLIAINIALGVFFLSMILRR